MSLALYSLSGNENEKITKEEIFRYALAINAEALAEPAGRKLEIPKTEDMLQAANVLRKLTITDFGTGLNGVGEIDYMALAETGGLGLFKNAVKLVKNVVEKVVDVKDKVVEKVVPPAIVNAVNNTAPGVQAFVQSAISKAAVVAENAAVIADKVVGLPLRAAVDVVLLAFGKKLSRGFLYAFLPESHPILAVNSKVKDKRAKALQAIKVTTEWCGFDEGTILRHIRNGIVKETGKSPEDILTNKFRGGLEGLGDPGTVAAIGAALVALLPVIPVLLKVFSKDDIPSDDDIQDTDPNEDVPDPLAKTETTETKKKKPTGEKSKFVEFITSPLGIGLSLLTIGGIGGGIWFGTRPKKKKGKK